MRYLGELVGSYGDLDVTDPWGEVPSVEKEPVEALLQLLHQLLPAAPSCSQLDTISRFSPFIKERNIRKGKIR